MSRRSSSIRNIVLAGAHELFAHTLAIRNYPFGLLSFKESIFPHEEVLGKPKAVSLVHGVIHNRSAFFSLKREMKAWGWKIFLV